MNKKYINRQDIERIAHIGKRKILIGGSALPFYGCNHRGTFDISIEVEVQSMDELEAIQVSIKKVNPCCDVTGNIDGWGMIPLPTGFRDRIKETGIDNLYILEPEDYVLSKMRRATQEDMQDALEVMKAQSLTVDLIQDRASMITLPMDPISFIFRQNLQSLYQQFDLQCHQGLVKPSIE